MAERWFLQVEGIPGDSLDERHRDQIEVRAWSIGAAAQSGVLGRLGGGLARVGRPTFEPLAVEAALGSASPALLLACVTGRRIASVVLTGGAAGDSGGPDVVTYACEDVTVTAVQHGDTVAGDPTDHVTFAYGTIRMTYRPQRPDGSFGEPVVAGFDTRTNRPL